jgi:ABC-type phosphate transport system permease subunit
VNTNLIGAILTIKAVIPDMVYGFLTLYFFQQKLKNKFVSCVKMNDCFLLMNEVQERVDISWVSLQSPVIGP